MKSGWASGYFGSVNDLWPPPLPRMSDGSQLSDALGALQQLVSASEAMLTQHERENVEKAIERAKAVLAEHEPMQTTPAPGPVPRAG